MEKEMFEVKYTFYNKYAHKKIFDTEEAAKKFFWAMRRMHGVTKVEYSAN
jgi:hypothetical protein